MAGLAVHVIADQSSEQGKGEGTGATRGPFKAPIPSRFWTVTPTWRPMAVLPVNETSGRRRSSAISAPMSAPPRKKGNRAGEPDGNAGGGAVVGWG